MRVLLAGGRSSLAQALRPVLARFSDVMTAGRAGCDVALDLAWPAERVEIPAAVDVVVNLAAHFGGSDPADLAAAEDVNVLGALKLAQACTRAGVGQFVQVSTVFAGLREDSPFFNAYALSKRHAEEALRWHGRLAGLPLAVLRPARIYGEGEAFRRHQPFLYALLDHAQRGDDIVLYGRNDALRNFIHVEDVAEVIARVVRQRIVGRYSCVNPTSVRISEIAAAALAAAGRGGAIRFDADKPDIPDDAFEADEALYRLIDFLPCVSLQQGLAREAARRRIGP